MKLRFHIVRVIGALLAVLSVPTSAQTHRMVYIGGGRVTAHPKIVNLYWNSNWDAANPGFTMLTLDNLTKAVLASNYLDKANQYGVFSGSFGGSHVPVKTQVLGTLCGNPPASTTNPVSVHAWVTCEAHTPGTGVPSPDSNTIYVVWVAAGTKIDVPAQIPFKICPSSPPPQGQENWVGYNAVMLDVDRTPYIVMPMICNQTIDKVTETLSHEIVEAATDGWFDTSGQDGWFDTTGQIGMGNIRIPNGSQVADFCPPQDQSVPFRLESLAVQSYWSNSDNACAAGDTTEAILAMPAITITPGPAIVQVNQNQQFTASSAVGGVTWSVSRPGSGLPGIIYPSGLYSAPPTLNGVGGPTAPRTVTVTATDSANRSGSTTICLRQASGVYYNGTMPVGPNETRQFMVWTMDHPTGVVWSVSGDGSIDSATGLYHSPSDIPKVHDVVTVRATGTDECGAFIFESQITLEPPPLGLNPSAMVGLKKGGTQQYTPIGQGSASLTWTVNTIKNPRNDPADGPGTISQSTGGASALYSAPSKILADHSVRIDVAASDGRSTFAIVNLLSDFAISPASTILFSGGQEQFSTNIVPPGGNCGFGIPCPAPRVSWTVMSGHGSVDAKGLYHAPATVVGNEAVVIKASVPDGRTATATVLLVGEVNRGHAPAGVATPVTRTSPH